MGQDNHMTDLMLSRLIKRMISREATVLLYQIIKERFMHHRIKRPITRRPHIILLINLIATVDSHQHRNCNPKLLAFFLKRHL